jgi:para-nitrobenzyl esterase
MHVTLTQTAMLEIKTNMLTRRQLLQDALLAAAALRFGPSTAAPLSTVEIRTPLGRLRGTREGSAHVFRGVPFAQPPIGHLRFRAPQPPKPWKGVRDATHFAAAAMQPEGKDFPQSEDCLYLNVWTPATPGTYPVFVWIHGGGFTKGRSSSPTYDGAAFARNGIVCITVAYRLGAFGFLDLESMLGSSYAGSANNGLRDLMAALTWVQENVAAFGGDPTLVTIGGESAGAKLVDILMGTPSARPLFHQIISESGGAERVSPRETARAITRGFAKTFTDVTRLPASALLTAPASGVLLAQESFLQNWPLHFPLRPEIDGELLPVSPLRTIQAGSSHGKRLLLGTNLDESATFIGPHPTSDPTAKDLGNLTVAQFAPIESAYRKLYPKMPADRLRIRMMSAEEYLIPSLRVAEAHVSTGSEAFVYRLDFPDTGRYAGLTPHGFDLRFVWDHFPAPASTPEQKLAMMVHSAWSAFIAGNAPEAEGLPPWPKFTEKKQATMILDNPSHVEHAPEAAELAIWKGLLTS